MRDRRHSHREERASERAFLRTVTHDPDAADARSPEPRAKVYKSFQDRLAAAERWLLGHVGRPWRKVEGEILATFDTRTIAGRHVVFDHLMPGRHRPWGEPELLAWRVRRRTFYVDRRGFLRVKSTRRDRRRFEVHHVRAEVVAFLAGRRVIVHGDRTYWRQPTDRVRRDGTLAYRQTRELDLRECAWWDALTSTERAFAQTPAKPNAEPKTRHVVHAPTRGRDGGRALRFRREFVAQGVLRARACAEIHPCTSVLPTCSAHRARRSRSRPHWWCSSSARSPISSAHCPRS